MLHAYGGSTLASDSPILDEILAEQGKPSTCQVCLWLLAQSPARQALWISTPEHGPITSMPVLVQKRENEGW